MPDLREFGETSQAVAALETVYYSAVVDCLGAAAVRCALSATDTDTLSAFSIEVSNERASGWRAAPAHLVVVGETVTGVALNAGALTSGIVGTTGGTTPVAAPILYNYARGKATVGAAPMANLKIAIAVLGHQEAQR